jgi:prepilin peptidase CpaA
VVELPPILYLLLIVIAVLSGIFDFREHRIPNWITLPGLILGLVANTVLAYRTGWRFALAGMMAAMLVYLPLYLIRGMGAGDVKLMVAIGAIVGPLNWAILFLSTAIVGGVAALALIVLRRRFYETWFNLQLLLASLVRFRAPYKNTSALDVRSTQALRMPHAISIAGGVFALIAISYLRFV